METGINFEKVGESGSVAIVLHGWGHSIDSVRSLCELLSAEMQVYMLDLPGFGASSALAPEAGTKDYAEAILRFMDENGLAKVSLIGHSFGGQVSIRIASERPERIERLVLIGSAGIRRDDPPAKALRFRAIALVRDSVKWVDRTFGANLFETWFVPRFGSPDYLAAGPLRPLLVKAVNEDLSEEARKITAPTLLVWGARDTATPIENGRKLERLIPNSRLVALPGKGHLAFSGTGAHLFAHYMLPFLNPAREAAPDAA